MAPIDSAATRQTGVFSPVSSAAISEDKSPRRRGDIFGSDYLCSSPRTMMKPRQSLPILDGSPELGAPTFASANTVRGGWAIAAPPKASTELSTRSMSSQSIGTAQSDEQFSHQQSGSGAPEGSFKERTQSQAYSDAGSRYQAMRKSCGDFRPLSSTNSMHSQASIPDMPPGCSLPTLTGPQKRALLVGINYRRTRGARPLTGCINDTKLVHKLLAEKFDFEDADIWVMTDEPIEFGEGVRHFTATKRNIVNGMRWLVNGASPGDHLFFHFSGHGSQVRDLNGDELDGWDEVILPSDYQKAGHILDDDIHRIMVRGLCKGAHLTVLVDACNSGTIMDLPFVHGLLGGELGNALGVPEEKIRASAKKAGNPQAKNVISRKLLKPIFDLKKKRRKEDAEIVRMADSLQRKVALGIKDNGLVVSFSGCADYQRSADTHAKTRTASYGAMTHAFASAIHSAELGSPLCTYQSLLDHMTSTLRRGGHIQTPQLCSSHDIDLGTQFEM